jgi:hypothetical protein
MITLFAAFVLLGLYLGVVAAVARSRRGTASRAVWMRATVIAAAARIGLFWALLALHWGGLLGLWALPLILLLLPEGLLLPRDFSWTIGPGLLVTGLLAAGTALWTAIALAVVRAFRRVARPPARPDARI